MSKNNLKMRKERYYKPTERALYTRTCLYVCAQYSG